MRSRGVMLGLLMLVGGAASADGKAPKAGKEMTQTVEAINRALALESYPPPHCLKWGYGHEITAAEVRACAEGALKAAPPPELGQSYVIAILMAGVGPQTVIALALDAPGWAVLSCDPGKPCPPRHAGDDKMGKRVVDRTDRACKGPGTIWLPERKGCL